jgi:hypothetical protein
MSCYCCCSWCHRFYLLLLTPSNKRFIIHLIILSFTPTVHEFRKINTSGNENALSYSGTGTNRIIEYHGSSFSPPIFFRHMLWQFNLCSAFLFFAFSRLNSLNRRGWRKELSSLSYEKIKFSHKFWYENFFFSKKGKKNKNKP